MSTEEPSRHEYFTAYAETLNKRFERSILANMQDKPLWVLWKKETDSKGNVHKRPYSPKNYPASLYKPNQWGSLSAALEALASGTFAGIGLMLPSPYVLIDKDATEDTPIYDTKEKKVIHPLALSLLEQISSYAELSPNNGLHIITEGTLLRGNFKTAQLELYTNWFATVTTKHLPGTPLTVLNQQAAIHRLEDVYHPEMSVTIFQNTGGVRGTSRLTELPPEATRDTVLQELLRGDMGRYGNDWNRADFVLLMKLLHWTGDDILLAKSIFLASPLGQRAKAQEPSGEGRRGDTNYVDRTIDHIRQKRQHKPMDR